MPPAGQLNEAVVADFEKWVSMGAPDPRARSQSRRQASTINIEKGRKYWAFQPPQKPAVPKVKNAEWSSEAIDRFLLARMEKERVTPVADADRAHLAPPRHPGPHRPAPHPRGNRRIRATIAPRCLRQSRRPPARLRPLRRALGPPLAGRRALRRFHRPRPQLPVPLRLALSQLGHRRL